MSFAFHQKQKRFKHLKVLISLLCLLLTHTNNFNPSTCQRIHTQSFAINNFEHLMKQKNDSVNPTKWSPAKAHGSTIEKQLWSQGCRQSPHRAFTFCAEASSGIFYLLQGLSQHSYILHENEILTFEDTGAKGEGCAVANWFTFLSISSTFSLFFTKIVESQDHQPPCAKKLWYCSITFGAS